MWQRFRSWPVHDRQDFLRWAVLYDMGGYFMDRNLQLLDSGFPWDMYLRQIDVCIVLDTTLRNLPSVNDTISPFFMKFPPQSVYLKKCMKTMLTGGSTSSWDILADVLKDNGIDRPARGKSISRIMMPPETEEVWMVASLNRWDEIWTETWISGSASYPPDSLFIHFTGFPWAMVAKNL
jgi:hypothetical protein